MKKAKFENMISKDLIKIYLNAFFSKCLKYSKFKAILDIIYKVIQNKLMSIETKSVTLMFTIDMLRIGTLFFLNAFQAKFDYKLFLSEIPSLNYF